MKPGWLVLSMVRPSDLVEEVSGKPIRLGDGWTGIVGLIPAFSEYAQAVAYRDQFAPKAQVVTMQMPEDYTP